MYAMSYIESLGLPEMDETAAWTFVMAANPGRQKSQRNDVAYSLGRQERIKKKERK
jgi:hypothetical protein